MAPYARIEQGDAALAIIPFWAVSRKALWIPQPCLKGLAGNMLLVIDVGNTQTVIGVYDGETLVHMWRLSTEKKNTADELRLKAEPLIERAGLSLREITGSALASVVPSLMQSWCWAISSMIGAEPLVCSAETAGTLFMADYPNPHEIGADRVADAVAARALYGAPVIIVDFGTATNIEVVDKDGFFIGGIIAPGVETSASALFSHATKLAATELIEPPAAIGKSSTEAIQSGVMYGEIDRVDGLVRRIFEQLGYTAPVVATGGLAPRMAPLSSTISETNSELTLQGLQLIYHAFVA